MGVLPGGNLSSALIQYIVERLNLTNVDLANTTLAELLPYLQNALDPYGINATKVVEDFFGECKRDDIE